MLLGLSGKARSGKNTAANIISSLGNTVTMQYALASPIKNIINDLFGWDERHSDGYLKEVVCYAHLPTAYEIKATLQHYLTLTDTELERMVDSFGDLIVIPYVDVYGLHISPRKAYQLFGTEVGRSARESLWLDEMERAYSMFNSEDSNIPGNFIITDVRFENEAEKIRDIGGRIIHIVRDSVDGAVNQHASEMGVAVADTDHVVHNNSSLKSLKCWFQILLSKLQQQEENNYETEEGETTSNSSAWVSTFSELNPDTVEELLSASETSLYKSGKF